MTPNIRRTCFALDPGATNWRLYRAVYEEKDGRLHLLSEPAPSPLTSFTERRLPSVLLLEPDGEGVACYGEAAEMQVEGDEGRPRVRAHFKPSIGSHLLADPQPHQQRYSHQEALTYTRMLFSEVLEGIRREKWRGAPFDDSVIFSIAHPVHWAMDAGGVVLEDFKRVIQSCFTEGQRANLRFVSEPEAAIYSLQRRALLPEGSADTSLIMDIGGSTMDLVASELRGDEPVFHSRYGSPLGGDLIDSAIAASIAEELGIPDDGLIRDPSINFRLRAVARHLKESLSRQLLQEQDLRVVPQRAVTIVTDDGDVYRGAVRLDEARFEALTGHLQDAFETNVDRALDAMQLHEDDIQRVLLVGGGSQLYSVVRYLRERFGADRVMIADNPAETVVHGASLEYGAATAKARPTMFFMTAFDLEEMLPGEVSETAPRWKLVGEDGKAYVLHEGENTIGRSPSSAIAIHSEKMSRTHACLTLTAGACSLIDLGSTNGTFVNEEQLQPETSINLEAGALLRFGDRTFQLETMETHRGSGVV